MPEVLFAPWRYEYLVAEKSTGCIFCEAAASTNEEESLVVHRGRRVFALLNRYPYTNGHLMVAPYEHAARLSRSDRGDPDRADRARSPGRRRSSRRPIAPTG